MTDTASKRARFRALHQSGCFVIPNPWDVGSARLLQHLGFQALASTSSGHAWTTGRPDYAVSRDEELAHLTKLCAATDLPVNADYQYGFAVEPEDVAANVRLAVNTGVAGLSIEDQTPGGRGDLHALPFAVERIRAARAAIDKLVAFADAGADCLYAPGVKKKADIAAMVRAVAPKPVNVLVWGPGLSVAELADLGVRRISVGGTLARVAWSAMLAAAEKMQGGSFDGLAGAVPGKQMNGIFAGFGG